MKKLAKRGENMPHKFKNIAIFLLISTITFISCLYINQQTKTINNHSTITTSIHDNIYTIQNIDSQDNNYHFNFNNPNHQELSLLIERAKPFDLYINQQLTFQYLSNDTYQRTHIIEIPLSIINEERLDFKLQLKENTQNDAIGRKQPIIFIGGNRKINQYALLSYGLIMLYIGVYFIICLLSIILFYYKRTETYLFMLSIISFIELCKTFIGSSIELLPFSETTGIHLLSLFYLISSILCALTSVYLVKQFLDTKIQEYLKPKFTLPFSVLYFLITYYSPYALSILLHYLLVILLIYLLCHCAGNGKKDVTIILIAYAILEGLQTYTYLAFDNSMISISKDITIYILPQLGSLICTVLFMFIVSRRFANKFNESDHLVQKLNQVNQQLDITVEQRTKELKEEQEQRHQMMMNIFHDLRSPVFILSEYIRRLELSNPKEGELLNSMKLRVSYLSSLIEDLFTIAKLESKQVIFDFDDVRIKNLLDHAVQDFENQANIRQIQLQYSGCPDVLIWGDHVRLQQAIHNIIINGLIYTPEQGKLTILCETEQDKLKIKIQDNGIGIPEENLPHIFTRYYKQNSTNKKSTGLGLSIAHDLIEIHHGKIEVESKINEGTTFTITLPMNE